MMHLLSKCSVVGTFISLITGHVDCRWLSLRHYSCVAKQTAKPTQVCCDSAVCRKQISWTQVCGYSGDLHVMFLRGTVNLTLSMLLRNSHMRISCRVWLLIDVLVNKHCGIVCLTQVIVWWLGFIILPPSWKFAANYQTKTWCRTESTTEYPTLSHIYKIVFPHKWILSVRQ